MPIELDGAGGRKSPFTSDYNLAPLFAEETVKSTQVKIFHLLTLSVPNSSPLKLVDSNYDVVFGGWDGHIETQALYTYTKFPFKWTPADVNSDGSISKSSITIANVSRELMSLVENFNGLRTCRVSIKTVYENALDEIYTPLPSGEVLRKPNPKQNNTAFVDDEFYIDNYSANEQVITFQLEPIIDLDIRLPRRRYMQDSCYFTYLDPLSCASDVSTKVVASVTTATTPTLVVAPQKYITTLATNFNNVPFMIGRLAVGTKIRLDSYVYSDTITLSGSDDVFTIMACSEYVDPSTAEVTYTYTLDKNPASNYVLGVIAILTCGKTLAECKARRNEKNFGGFPGISSVRKVWL